MSKSVMYNSTTGKIDFDGSTYDSLRAFYDGTTKYGIHWGSDWTYYPYYPSTTIVRDTVYRESKFDTAFRVVETLMEKGHIKKLAVEDFIKLVKEIAATL